MKLLTLKNPKIEKSNRSNEYLSAILHLAPGKLSGITNVCPAASNGCLMSCLNTAGRGRFDSIQKARIKKTRWLFQDRNAFMTQLCKDIDALIRKADRENKKPVIRLNGTSDIAWESFPIDEYPNVFSKYPNVQWYDYTKRPDRLLKNRFIKNYHLTFSQSESNGNLVKSLIRFGHNVAVVFDQLPEFYLNIPVIDGNVTDLRFLDQTKVIVGLTAKGKAKKDESGFVVKIKDQLEFANVA